MPLELTPAQVQLRDHLEQCIAFHEMVRTDYEQSRDRWNSFFADGGGARLPGLIAREGARIDELRARLGEIVAGPP